MTYLDAPSDNPVGGSKGRLIMIPSSVGVPALETLHGMGVGIRSDLSGHNPRFKIGVVERAWAGNPEPNGAIPVHVEGFFYAKDFPDIVEDLRAEKNEIGFSYEASAVLENDPNARVPTAIATQIVFTGLAALYKNKAAYTKTSLAAEGDEMDENQIKALIASAVTEALKGYVTVDALNAATVKVTELETALNASTEKVTALETALTAATEKIATYETLAASVEDVKTKVGEVSGKIEPLVTHTEAIKAAAEEREKFTRRSSGPVSLMAKYQIEEQSDLKAELDVISKRSDLDVATRIAMKMEAQARHATKA